MSTYQFQPYPAHRHGPNGTFRVVTNADEDAIAQAEGWATHPSLVGKPKAAEVPNANPGLGEALARIADHTPHVVTPAPAQTKAAKAPAKPKAQKAPPAAPPPPPAPVCEVEPPAFDRTAAIARLEAANFEVDPATTDAELIEALVELDK